MKGATAELCAKITKTLKTTKIMIMGANQKRLRTFKKSHNSFKMVILDIGYPFEKLFKLKLLRIFLPV